MQGYSECLAQQGLCSPMRKPFLTAISPYVSKFRVQAWGEYVAGNERVTIAWVPDADIWAHFHYCRIILPTPQVRWVEYVVWSTNYWRVVSRPYDPRNQEWGQRRKGVMPFHRSMFPMWMPGCKHPALVDPKLIAQRVAYVNSPHFKPSG